MWEAIIVLAIGIFSVGIAQIVIIFSFSKEINYQQKFNKDIIRINKILSEKIEGIVKK